MSILRHIALLFGTLLVAVAAHAQPGTLVEANRMYQSGDLPGARRTLDEAVKSPDFSHSPEAWVLRGFVYKDIFKAMPPGPEADVIRDEALASLFTSTVVDTAKEYSQSSLQAYDFLCKTTYNDAARALNDLNEERALALYAKYKENVLRLDPSHRFHDRDIEFNNALGTVYTKRFNQDREDSTWFDKAVALYKRVLQLDSNNYGANYNLATLYYNRGVYNIQRISSNTDIPSIQQIQDVSREYFTQALPYMLKAHNMNPKRRETLLGLEGIHYSLQDTEKSEEYRHKYEALDQESPPKDAPQEQPKDK
jgi:tetratricopeptide (TPR) repeat protein